MFSCMAWAQRSIARNYYKGNYDLIVQSAAPEKLTPIGRLYYASSLYRLREYPQAYQEYQKAFTELPPNETVDATFYVEYGSLLSFYGDISGALAYLQKAAQNAKDPDLLQEIDLRTSQVNSLKSNTNSFPESIKVSIHILWEANSIEHDYSALPDPKKGGYYFISRRDPARKSDRDFMAYEGLWYWKPGSPPEKAYLTPAYHEGVSWIMGDSMVVYRSKGRRGDFHISVRRGDRWSEPILWKEFPNDRQGSEDHMCLDPKTGDIIYSSDRKGTTGGKDLWRTYRLPNGKFAPPQNLGMEINTPYDEDAPYIIGDTLFFAHNGPRSFGGYDIFYAVRSKDGRFRKPQHLPPPINGPGNESYFVWLTPDTMLLSTERVGGKGKMDLAIVVFEKIRPEPPPPPVAKKKPLLRGYTFNARTGERIGNSYVEILPELDEQPIWASFTNSEGNFETDKPTNPVFYIRARAKNFLDYLERVENTRPDEDEEKPLPMIPVEELKAIRLPRIHFNFDKSDLRPESPKKLDEVIAFLEDAQRKNLVLEVAGHTDSIGTVVYNQGLSERRANAAVVYLAQKGIDRRRLVPKGYSELRPLVPNSTPQNRFLNRRVEFYILSTPPPTSQP
ncbi:MAG: OmpA family protein [Bacteroidia bacterium]